MRTVFAAFAVIVLATPAAAQSTGFPVTVESCGRAVTFDAPPQRAVANDINLTEMMLALGLQDHMVGVTGIDDRADISPHLRERLDQLPRLSAEYPSAEVLLGADPDFFFAGWNYGLSVGGELTPESLGRFDVPVYELTESCIHIMDKPKISLQDVYTDLRNLGKIFGVEDRAEQLIAGYQARLAALSVPPGTPRVFVYDSGLEQPFTAGRYAMPTAMIEAAGGTNVMESVAASWTTVGWESVLAADPEVIIIVDYGAVTARQKIDFLTANPAFSDMSAVKNQRFVVLSYDEATPGIRNVAAIEKLARELHPDRLN